MLSSSLSLPLPPILSPNSRFFFQAVCLWALFWVLIVFLVSNGCCCPTKDTDFKQICLPLCGWNAFLIGFSLHHSLFWHLAKICRMCRRMGTSSFTNPLPGRVRSSNWPSIANGRIAGLFFTWAIRRMYTKLWSPSNIRRWKSGLPEARMEFTVPRGWNVPCLPKRWKRWKRSALDSEGSTMTRCSNGVMGKCTARSWSGKSTPWGRA